MMAILQSVFDFQFLIFVYIYKIYNSGLLDTRNWKNVFWFLFQIVFTCLVQFAIYYLEY